MKTTATNKKLRVILSAIQNGTLKPNPEFQRRLVWSSKHKNAFLRTVLEEYPFPEIYVAAGDVNPETAEGTEMLVDGQQRITTLYQYFKGSADLKLEANVVPYSELKLDPARLLAFLEYEVVVRDLGQVSKDQITEVFHRINSTKYSLTAVEVHNARFDGEFKRFAEDLAAHRFFEEHRIFPAASIRRMNDLRFALTLAVTMLSSYFHRDNGLDEYLSQYNDHFPHQEALQKRFESIFGLIDEMHLDPKSRAWSEVNLLPVFVELDRSNRGDAIPITAKALSRLSDFFVDLTQDGDSAPSGSPLAMYFAAQRYATADRSTRMKRGETVRKILDGIGRDEWRRPRQDG